MRLSESIAKMHLSDKVEASHVQEAHRLFKESTLNTAKYGGDENAANAQHGNLIKEIEDAVLKRMQIGQR